MYVNCKEPELAGENKRQGKKGCTESAVLVFDWCLQIENTPTIRLPKEAKAEIVAETFAGAAMFGTDMNPTVALSYIYISGRGVELILEIKQTKVKLSTWGV